MRGRKIDWAQIAIGAVIIIVLNILSQIFDWGWIFY